MRNLLEGRDDVITGATSSSAAAGGTVSTGGGTSAGYGTSHGSSGKSEKSRQWHVFWADKDWIHGELDRIHLEPHQRVNHFRNYYELTRKDLLAKNLKRTDRSTTCRWTKLSQEIE